MADIIIKKLNEVFLKIECDDGISKELNQFFSFRVPGFQFVPAYKNKLWDGFIRLFSIREKTLYHGLIDNVIRFCVEREYSYEIESSIVVKEEFSLIDAVKFIDSLSLPSEYTVRDYQLESFVDSIRNKRLLILSPTGSGKSFIIYLIIRWLHKEKFKKGLIITPTTSLVEQLFSDFKSYGWNSEEYCHRQYSGKEKNTDLFLTLSTWQSIYTKEKEYFEQFDFVIGDESHSFKAKSLTTIMTSLTNAKYRIGCTGTLDGTQTHKLVLEGLFGRTKKIVTTKELIDRKQLASFKIKCLILKYREDTCKIIKNEDYNFEKQFLATNSARNNFIKNLTLSLNKNTLVLFQLVEKQGKILFDIINESAKDKKVFFVYGGTDVETRESIRAIAEKENNSIIIASYGTFSQGINIKNLHNIIFASPSKSRIRNLQSIGRALRTREDKDEAILYDIADDFRTGKYVNHTLKHFTERIKIYNEEKFPYKFYTIELKNG